MHWQNQLYIWFWWCRLSIITGWFGCCWYLRQFLNEGGEKCAVVCGVAVWQKLFLPCEKLMN